jgi:hypothetical protein|tara:strand:- start:83 stop:466 length:384 start_codon:yes stop_codon:yes gene_type:complete
MKYINQTISPCIASEITGKISAYDYNVIDKAYSEIYGAEQTYLKKYIDDLLADDDVVNHFENLDSDLIHCCAGEWLEDIIYDHGFSPLLWSWAFHYWLEQLDNLGVDYPEEKKWTPKNIGTLSQWIN